MKNIFIIIVIIVFSASQSKGQSFESSLLFNKANFDYSYEKDNLVNNGFALHLGLQSEVYKNLFCELRPGIMYAGDYFSGGQIGFFVKYNFIAGLIGNIGFNLHFNSGGGHGNSTEVYTYDNNYGELGIGLSYKVSIIGFNFTYFYPFNKERARTYSFESDKTSFVKLNNTISFGIELAFLTIE